MERDGQREQTWVGALISVSAMNPDTRLGTGGALGADECDQTRLGAMNSDRRFRISARDRNQVGISMPMDTLKSASTINLGQRDDPPAERFSSRGGRGL